MSYVVSKNKAKYSTRYQRRELGEVRDNLHALLVTYPNELINLL
ncbi:MULTISPECIES: hypothetical protein [Priestia]|uniref:Uncharacterized protein n=1 Tax=Priestia megaterium Q3 TaxID=1452722 RepID=A0A806U7V1_PRIMG|nr:MULTISPECIES: hypothetical protein [Priestia]AKP78183.1 hypothetical protein AS52_03222 [Priestia megaterium Q3]MEB4857596.1 hypothetical protein [Priestia megaterium]MEB4868782.1 hypothetical protein [Priestia megaterium]MED3884812.1 hypothetical protein [Priestia aryabhattai]MED3948304.1 hypothetical protein [Priestia aryabhattai]